MVIVVAVAQGRFQILGDPRIEHVVEQRRARIAVQAGRRERRQRASGLIVDAMTSRPGASSNIGACPCSGCSTAGRRRRTGSGFARYCPAPANIGSRADPPPCWPHPWVSGRSGSWRLMSRHPEILRQSRSLRYCCTSRSHSERNVERLAQGVEPAYSPLRLAFWVVSSTAWQAR